VGRDLRRPREGHALHEPGAFPHLRERGGAIVNFGSSAGIRHARGFAVYGAAKGAIAAWSRNIALEWGRYDIRVNTVAPVMESAMRVRSAIEMDPQEQYEFEHRIGREKVKVRGGALGDPLGDLAPMLVLLVSDGGSYVTGQVITVDGGMVMLGS
jgi:NAD(P)-dependent dehydrogenase (short-subunit alcohol dehydrogenase family)